MRRIINTAAVLAHGWRVCGGGWRSRLWSAVVFATSFTASGEPVDFPAEPAGGGVALADLELYR